MSQIGILSGYGANENADFVESYPINLEPVVGETGLSKGYLKSPPGAVGFATGPGFDRGGINWNGTLYRVMGGHLIRVDSDGATFNLGEISDDAKPVSLDYSFDRLSIGSGGNLYYYIPGEGIVQVTDPDLGLVVDHIFASGYFMTTDGENLVVTDLNDPMSVDPTKYGSSETDPDPVKGLLLLRDEVYALNLNTIDVFNNVGGTGFPWALNRGATIPKGIIGTRAKCLYLESFAFVGAGRKEALGAYIAGSGSADKISTRAIDQILAAEPNPENIICESLSGEDEQRLYIHLSNQTLVYLAAASARAGQPVWYHRRRGPGMTGAYRPRFFVNAYNRVFCGDIASFAVGVLDPSTSRDFNEANGWRFDTTLLYNEGNGGIAHSLELVGLPGRAPLADRPVVFFSRTLDGETFSEERTVSAGRFGERAKRVQCRPHWKFENYMGLSFRGADNSVTGWARLEASIEPLGV